MEFRTEATGYDRLSAWVLLAASAVGIAAGASIAVAAALRDGPVAVGTVVVAALLGAFSLWSTAWMVVAVLQQRGEAQVAVVTKLPGDARALTYIQFFRGRRAVAVAPGAAVLLNCEPIVGVWGRYGYAPWYRWSISVGETTVRTIAAVGLARSATAPSSD